MLLEGIIPVSMKSINTFFICFNNQVVACCVTKFKSDSPFWTINLTDSVVELTCEPDDDMKMQWYINGMSDCFSEALGAAIINAKK